MELRNQEKARTIRMPGSSTSYPHHHHCNHPDQSHRQKEVQFSSFIPPSSAATHTITGADQDNGRGVEGRQVGEHEEEEEDDDDDDDDAAIYTTQTLDHPPRHAQGRQQQQDGQLRKPRSDRADSADRAPSSIHRLHPDDQPPAPPTTNPTAVPVATGISDVSHLTGGSASSMKKYTECQRNHAAHLGGYVLDGCGEFMPGGETGTPKALLCAACDCHRNFHRQVVFNGETHIAATQFPPPTMIPAANHTTTILTTRSPLQPPPIGGGHLITPPAPPLSSAAYYHPHHRIGPAMMAFGGGNGGGGAAAESSSEDLHMFGIAQNHQHRQRMMEFGSSGLSGSKKRFRTKFTQDQKDKMAEFAENIGWRIQKQDHVELQQFCDQIGVKRRVFKVWMHNNKQGMKNKQG